MIAIRYLIVSLLTFAITFLTAPAIGLSDRALVALFMGTPIWFAIELFILTTWDGKHHDRL